MQNETLPLDYEPSLNHQAKMFADEMVASGEVTSWDHAYETYWDFLETMHSLVMDDAPAQT